MKENLLKAIVFINLIFLCNEQVILEGIENDLHRP